MENISLLNKKGLSEMVGYVLLVAIAIGISVGVTLYLNAYIPKEKPECPEDISLLIKDASCKVVNTGSISKTELALTLYNNGLHNVDASYIRMDTEGKKSKKWINNPSKPEIGDSNFYFYSPAGGTTSLAPGKEKSYLFDISDFKEGAYVLEIQPAVFSKNLIAACPAVLSQKLHCEVSSSP